MVWRIYAGRYDASAKTFDRQEQVGTATSYRDALEYVRWECGYGRDYELLSGRGTRYAVPRWRIPDLKHGANAIRLEA